MLKKTKSKTKNIEFIGPVFEERYRELISTNKKAALPYLRRAALLLYPLKPALWEEYMQLKKEVFKEKNKKHRLSNLSKEMEGL